MGGPTFQFVGKEKFTAPSESAKVDVVFVHGLDGHPVATWSFTNDYEGFWPHWLAVDLPFTNVWSAGYDTAPFIAALAGEGGSIHDSATVLLDFLTSKSLGQRSLIFVTHSLGGLVVKRMLRLCSDSFDPTKKTFLAATKAVVFCATPHQGSGVATVVSTILKVIVSKHVKQLAFNEEQLLDLSHWFRNWAAASGVQVAAYYETKKTRGFMIVNKASANPNVAGCDPIAIDSDHIEMCKPSAHESQLYVSVKALISKLTNNPPSSSTGSFGIKALTALATSIPAFTPANGAAQITVDAAIDAPKPEVLADYEYFTTQAPHDRRTLEQKLVESGRDYEVNDAKRKKERFAMSLHRHCIQGSAMARYVRLMSDVETRFTRHVRPAIAQGADVFRVNELVQTSVIDSALAAQKLETDDITSSVVESALYYLTGNCHVRWGVD